MTSFSTFQAHHRRIFRIQELTSTRNPFCSRASRLTLNACRRLSRSIVLNRIKAYRKHVVPEGFLHKFERVLLVYHACKHIVKLLLFPLSIQCASLSTGVHEFLPNATWTPLHIRFHNVDTTLLSPLVWWCWHTVVIKEVVRHRCLFHNFEVSAGKFQLVNRQWCRCISSFSESGQLVAQRPNPRAAGALIDTHKFERTWCPKFSLKLLVSQDFLPLQTYYSRTHLYLMSQFRNKVVGTDRHSTTECLP